MNILLTSCLFSIIKLSDTFGIHYDEEITTAPTLQDTYVPTRNTDAPTYAPTLQDTYVPTRNTDSPTYAPTIQYTYAPTIQDTTDIN